MRWYQKIPFAVVSVILSLGVGVVLWLAEITDPGLAFLSALGLEIVIVVHRILSHLERADPIRGLEQAPEIEEALTQARTIAHSRNAPARLLLDQTIFTFADRVQKLGSSGIKLSPEEFMDFAEQLFDSARHGDTLKATSLLAGGTYWSRAYGSRYERINRQAFENGLSIDRIYLLSDQEHLNDVRAILDRQTKFSKVKIVLLNEWEMDDDNLHVPRRDFFVFNKEVTAEFVFAEPNMAIQHILICTELHGVEAMDREYEQIRKRFSQDWDVAASEAS